MTLIADKFNLYTSVSEHDYKTESCATWVDHYNFLATLSWNTDAERQQFEYEMTDYLCYDV